jgi:hypothetical protein
MERTEDMSGADALHGHISTKSERYFLASRGSIALLAIEDRPVVRWATNSRMAAELDVARLATNLRSSESSSSAIMVMG